MPLWFSLSHEMPFIFFQVSIQLEEEEEEAPKGSQGNHNRFCFVLICLLVFLFLFCSLILVRSFTRTENDARTDRVMPVRFRLGKKIAGKEGKKRGKKREERRKKNSRFEQTGKAQKGAFSKQEKCGGNLSQELTMICSKWTTAV
jgi:hypothetical protein